MGTLITYGSYIRKDDNMAGTAVSVAAADTFIAVLAGIAIFPAIYAFADVEHLKVDQITDEGLAFITLPNILNNVPGGQIFSTLFFILLAVAAVTSTISMLEVIVAYFIEELKMVRPKATLVAVVSTSFLGILSVYFSGVFRFLNYTTVNILLPLGGLLIVLFIGWFYGMKNTKAELCNNGGLKGKYIPLYMFIVRFIAPIAISVVFIYGIINSFN